MLFLLDDKVCGGKDVKKILLIMLSLILVVGLVSCGDNTDNSVSPDDNSSVVEVDKGLLVNTITMPASFFEDMTEDEINANAEEAGYQSYEINSDGSVTYTMTKAKHKEKLEEFASIINESIDSLLSGDEDTKVDSFTKIEHNKNYSQIDIYVNKDEYTTWDMMYAISFYIQGAYYQSFEGASSEDIDVVVNFIDDKTDDTIDSGSFRAWVDNMEDSNYINDNTGDSNSNTKDTVTKTLILNETVTVGNLMEITLTESEWVESLTPSNTGGYYSYYEDQEGEKYFVIRGTLKNIGSEDLDIKWMSESEVVLNDTYKFNASMELESNDGTDFYGSAKPLQTLNLVVYASVSDEAYSIYDTVDVTMSILNSAEDINSFYYDDLQHETLKISFTK